MKLFDDNGTKLAEGGIGGVSSLYYENGIILAMNTTRVIGYDTQFTQQYVYDLHSYGTATNHLVMDIDGDGVNELVFLQNTTIMAIEIANGDIIFTEAIPGGEINGFTDLSTTILDGKQYYSAATTASDRYTVYLLDENGTSISADSIYYFNTTSSRVTHEIGDFDGDGELEISLLRYTQTMDTVLQMYDLSTQDLFTVDPITNITLVSEGLSPDFAPDIISDDTRQDGASDIILWTNKASQQTDLPALQTSALYAIDMSSANLIWSRTFTDTIKMMKIEHVNNSLYFVLNTDNKGTFVLTEEGVDLFWLNTGSSTSDLSIADLQDTYTIVDIRLIGNAEIFGLTGVLTAQQNTITAKENKAVAETIQYYVLSDTTYTSYQHPVDINRDGASDLFVGFSNGTIALRSYQLGEYWRVDVDDFDNVASIGLRYAENQNGLAISYDPGRLVIFDRISTRAVVNVSNSFPSESLIDMKILSPDGKVDYILVRNKIGSSTAFHLFNPIQQSFIWNYTTGGFYSDFDIGFLDSSKPNYPTHIIYGSSTIYLIQLPTTLLTSGQIQPANDASTWIDHKVITTTEGLTQVYLMSSSGDFGIFTINHNAADTYQEYQLGLSGLTHFSMYHAENDSYYLVEKSGLSFLFVENGTMNYMFNISKSITSTDFFNQLTDLNGDDTPELLLYARNELYIYNITGDLQEIRSFSSSILNRELWYPDLSGVPIVATHLFNQNIELVDPAQREYSTYIASVSNIVEIPFDYQEPGKFTPPDGSWPAYQVPETDTFDYIPWLLAIPLLVATIAIIIRRQKL